jgi:hypothetical protein
MKRRVNEREDSEERKGRFAWKEQRKYFLKNK